jgi:acetoacetate decarboxylase
LVHFCPQTSGVGPYQELLFIPGLFHIDGRYTFSISKIYVSTEASVRSGIENWAIPKELADFKIDTQDDGSTLYRSANQLRVGGRLFVKRRC